MIKFDAQISDFGDVFIVDLYTFQDSKQLSHYRWKFDDAAQANQHYEHLRAINQVQQNRVERVA